MSGWISVLVVVAVLTAAAVILIHRVARRWPDYLVILVLAALLSRPLYILIGGDVSRILPTFLWSEGGDGKDQIILASIASTLLLPPIAAAIVLLIVKWSVNRHRD